MSRIQIFEVSLEDLKKELAKDRQREWERFKKDLQPKAPDEFLTRQEVANMLKIDLSTVHAWTKKGRLKSYGIGNRVYYKRGEVEAAMQPLNH